MSNSTSRRGGTLTELMVATVILSVGILGLFGAFKFIARSTLISRATSMATNLGQERIESLKNLNYYSLQITTDSVTHPTITNPPLTYDTVNYPPETIAIGGINFTRYTYVGMAEMTGSNISTVAFTYPDTGLKQITVDIVWTEAGRNKRWTLRNLLENPNVNPLDATISGSVTNSAGGNVAGAVVVVEQNEDWGATANASGAFSFSVYHGTYTLRASSAGFSDGVSASFIAPKGPTTTVPAISLTAYATGTVTGTVWLNKDIVISQVVADTETVVSDGSPQHVEYFELFNPTTYSITIGTKAVGSPNYYFYTIDQNWNYQCQGCDWAPTVTRSYITHVSSYVGPGRYYLLANASSFYLSSGWVRPDAYFTNAGGNQTYPNLLTTCGSIGILNSNTWDWSDIVGWSRSGVSAPMWPSYGLPVPNSAGDDGLQENMQIVRVSSPGISGAAVRSYGSAYNSGSNKRDFYYDAGTYFKTLPAYPPRTTASGVFTTLTGMTPNELVAYATTYVSASDPHSGSTTAFTAYVTSGALSLPYTRFQLSGVSTGTWSVVALYSTYSNTYDNVVVTQNKFTGVPNDATTPAWDAAGHAQVKLSSVASMGFIKGTVTNTANAAINGIVVQGGGVTKTTGSNGVYFMPVSSGTITVIANPNNANANYVEGIAAAAVAQGAVTTQNFTLNQGGRITGYVTTGTTPLSNQAIAATNGVGSQVGSAVTDASGNFTMRNISTGTYTIFPVLESGQDTDPNSLPATLGASGSVFTGTFTVSGAFGSISGTVTDASGLVTSGALILASTTTIASSPAAIVGSSAPAQVPLYMVSSKADGTFVLPVRGGSTYNLSAYVPVISGTSVSITTKTYSGIVVSASAATTRNVTIP